MRYKPWELHRITFKEVQLAIEGFYEQNKYYHDLMRMATSYICLSGFNAKNAISQLKMGWPIERKAGKISEAAIKQLRLLKELDKQNAGGSKISS